MMNPIRGFHPRLLSHAPSGANSDQHAIEDAIAFRDRNQQIGVPVPAFTGGLRLFAEKPVHPAQGLINLIAMQFGMAP